MKKFMKGKVLKFKVSSGSDPALGRPILSLLTCI